MEYQNANVDTAARAFPWTGLGVGKPGSVHTAYPGVPEQTHTETGEWPKNHPSRGIGAQGEIGWRVGRKGLKLIYRASEIQGEFLSSPSCLFPSPPCKQGPEAASCCLLFLSQWLQVVWMPTRDHWELRRRDCLTALRQHYTGHQCGGCPAQSHLNVWERS